MSINIQTHSRLRFTNLFTLDGITFWDLLDLPTIVPQSDDQQYTVLNGDRIDQIANKFYGNPILWWVIAEANGLDILPTNLYGSQILTIPSPRYVLQDLFHGSVNG